MASLGQIWTFIILILLAFILPVIIIVITSAGENFWNVLNDLIMKGFLSILLLTFSGGLLLLGVIIAYSHPRIGKIISYVGIVGVLLTLLFIEVSVVGLTGKNRLKNEFIFQECKQLPVIVEDVSSLPDSLSCILTGYLPKNYSTIYIIGYWIFGIAIPLLITSGIFLDLVQSSGIITNRMSQRLIGWGLGFLAYRGLVVSNLIYIIDFISAGMAVIVLNFIFVGGLLAYTNRIFSQWKSLENAIEFGKSIQIARVNSKRILEEAIKRCRSGSAVNDVYNTLISPFEADLSTASKEGWLKIQSSRTKNQQNPNQFVNDLERIKNKYYG
ncbi:MAG: hypothetical protein KQA41_02150 [Candidatus Aenigmarchaeota archaeon]|nr:hypothetical protein [Candidatus Aenigmarchaeota archaeon]MBU5689003.1 hypothetical protein [Candidatus Aenigmarchaeota archaeon]